jgi:hypothetical protein
MRAIDTSSDAGRKSCKYNMHKLLIGVLLLLLPGCASTRGKYFSYSILPKIPGNYVVEIEYQESSEEQARPDWEEQARKKALAAAKFVLEKHGIPCNRLFSSDTIKTMYNGVYAAVDAGNWGDGYSNHEEIKRDLLKAYEERKTQKIRPRVSIADGKESFQNATVERTQRGQSGLAPN